MEGRKERHPLFLLDDHHEFPPVDTANEDGLLALGGDLAPERLLLAYKNGVFPWFDTDALLMWWSPDPRMVLFPENIKVSKTMKKVMRDGIFNITQNTEFKTVMSHCAKVERKGQSSTWITPNMISSYVKLHEMGFAKSYEVWRNDKLVGGLYGIDLGHIFCGESMFSLESNASKYALIQLAKDLRRENYKLIDCQVYTSHLASMGAEEISRKEFMRLL